MYFKNLCPLGGRFKMQNFQLNSQLLEYIEKLIFQYIEVDRVSLFFEYHNNQQNYNNS